LGQDASEKKPWPWPAELDAMTAAPEHHTLLFENEHVRVLNAHVAPGETVPMHTHCWPGVLYILGVSDFVRRNPAGEVLFDTRGASAQAPVGSSVWGDALPPHSLENVGTTELRNITFELKHLT
jgi:quercetin dioxygenase-like cupin family protein